MRAFPDFAQGLGSCELVCSFLKSKDASFFYFEDISMQTMNFKKYLKSNKYNCHILLKILIFICI
jgi:hypothetical protein